MRGIEELVNPDDPAAAREMFAGTTALKRYGLPEEIAELVHFLLSDASSYITGRRSRSTAAS
jgi:NAD(P)-dependent dehydrogenase (short-subunit alcohol dehydrogenase family)